MARQRKNITPNNQLGWWGRQRLEIHVAIIVGIFGLMAAILTAIVGPIVVARINANLTPVITATYFQAAPAATVTRTTALSTATAPVTQAAATICGGNRRIPAQLAKFTFRADLGVAQYNVEANKEDVGIANNRIRSIAIDKRGVWFGYFPIQSETLVSGISQLTRQEWEFCNSSTVAVGQNANSIAFDLHSDVWVATDGYGVQMFDGTTWHSYTHENSELPDDRTYSVVPDASGNVYVTTWQGVAKFDATTLKWTTPYTAANSHTLLNDTVDAFLLNPSGEVWIGHIDGGISRLTKQGQWLHYTNHDIPTALASDKIRDFVTDREGRVWIATDGGGVSRFDPNASTDQQWHIYKTTNSTLPDDRIRSLALDKYGRVWAATQSGVSYFIDDKANPINSKWQLYAPVDAFSIAFGPPCVDGVECPYNDDHVWLGTVNQGITHSRVPPVSDVIRVVSMDYPKQVMPNQAFVPRITIEVLPGYELREQATKERPGGDELRYVRGDDPNRLGAYELIPVKGTVEAGTTLTFTDAKNPYTAPKTPGTYKSIWRIWQAGRYVGPEIVVEFTVVEAAGTPVAPAPTLIAF